jgi:hypothetical protein
VDIGRLSSLGLLATEPVDWSQSPGLIVEVASAAANLQRRAGKLQLLTIALATTRGETALLGLAATLSDQDWAGFKAGSPLRDLSILATYLHNHLLRLHGVASTEEDILASARDLDDLKWTEEGRTAWEASRIFRISERTVRSHLESPERPTFSEH